MHLGLLFLLTKNGLQEYRYKIIIETLKNESAISYTFRRREQDWMMRKQLEAE